MLNLGAYYSLINVKMLAAFALKLELGSRLLFLYFVLKYEELH